MAPNTLDGTFWLDTTPDISNLYVTATIRHRAWRR